MASWTLSDDYAQALSREPSHGTEASSSWIQDYRAATFCSGGESSNHFDTPEDTLSLNAPSGCGEDWVQTYHNLENRTSSQHLPQENHLNCETIDPSMLTRETLGPLKQDNGFMMSTSSVFGRGSTRDMYQSIDRSSSDDEEEGTLLEDANKRNFPFTQHDVGSTPHDDEFSVQRILREEWLCRSQPSSSMDPWSPYGTRYPQDYHPEPHKVMFAPEDDMPGITVPLVNRYAEYQEREVYHEQQLDKYVSCEVDIEEEEMIDEPPIGDPVGPPVANLVSSSHGPEKPRQSGNLGRRGKLDELTARNAKIMRDKGNCWPCRLLKYKCDPSDPCLPCSKARYSSVFHLGCVRDRLPEFTSVFLPASVMEQHEHSNLCQFVRRHVRRWTLNDMTVSVTWGYGQPIMCKVQEFEPIGNFLLLHSQYRWNMEMSKYDTVQVSSPPIGIVLMEPGDWRKKSHAYLDREVEENFTEFPDRCFRDLEFEVQKDVVKVLHSHYIALKQKVRELGPQTLRAKASEIKILVKSCETLNLCLKLLMSTHIMTRTLTLVESTKQQIYSQLQRPPPEMFGRHTSSRLLNKELKYIFAPIHHEAWKEFLDQVQNTLMVGHKDKLPSWATVLACLLTLAIIMESTQVNIRCKEATDKSERIIPENSDVANIDLQRMDEKWELLVALFHKAYTRLHPTEVEEHKAKLDSHSQEFAGNVNTVIRKHRGFLESRRRLGPPLRSQDPNNSRLLAQLLLSLVVDANQPESKPSRSPRSNLLPKGLI